MNDAQETLRGSPAGRPSDAVGQQPEGVIVLNARDERVVAWLIEQVGFDSVRQAITRISGKRKAYPTNLAKVLGLMIPPQVINTPSDAALERIQELRRAGLVSRGRP